MINELLPKKKNLEATKTKLQDSLGKTLHDLDLLTEVEPVDPAELVGLQGSATNLTGSIARIDRALETVDRQLSVAQAAQRRLELLDAIEVAAEAAVAATAAEGRQYDLLFTELGAVLTKIVAARDDGAGSREYLRGLLRTHAPAHPALFYLGPTTTKQETAAVQLETELRERGVDVSAALDSYAALPGGALLIRLLESHQLDNSRKLLEVS